MKNNLNSSIDKNNILNSYKIDLENKKSNIIKALKNEDNEKLNDMILEYIYKPDMQFLDIAEEQEEKPSVSLVEKERNVTFFKRYNVASIDKEIIEEPFKLLIEDELIQEEQEEQKELSTLFEEANSTPLVVVKKRAIQSTPLAYKDRIITNFRRGSKNKPSGLNIPGVRNYEDNTIPKDFSIVEESENNEILNVVPFKKNEKIDNHEHLEKKEIIEEINLGDFKKEPMTYEKQEEIIDNDVIYPVTFDQLKKDPKNNKIFFGTSDNFLEQLVINNRRKKEMYFDARENKKRSRNTKN